MKGVFWKTKSRKWRRSISITCGDSTNKYRIGSGFKFPRDEIKFSKSDEHNGRQKIGINDGKFRLLSFRLKYFLFCVLWVCRHISKCTPKGPLPVCLLACFPVASFDCNNSYQNKLSFFCLRTLQTKCVKTLISFCEVSHFQLSEFRSRWTCRETASVFSRQGSEVNTCFFLLGRAAVGVFDLSFLDYRFWLCVCVCVFLFISFL